MEIIDIITQNGSLITANIYATNNNLPVLIVASATGVKQGFYKKFASFISKNGIAVVTFDYAGIGFSLKQPIKQQINNASDWGKNDLEAVIQYVKENYQTSKITLLGHSIGGQLIGLAKSSSQVQKLILVAAQSGYWKLWEGRDRLRMWLNWHLLFPLFNYIFGYLPSKKISGMENLPKKVVKQWSSWGRKPNYLFDEVAEQDLYFKNIFAKTVAISIENDFYAPKKAVDWLAEKYQNANVKRIHLKPNDYDTNQIGHFGIFSSKFENNLWKLLFDEIEK
jgi:predicted alpha/beta hydrolase